MTIFSYIDELEKKAGKYLQSPEWQQTKKQLEKSAEPEKTKQSLGLVRQGAILMDAFDSVYEGYQVSQKAKRIEARKAMPQPLPPGTPTLTAPTPPKDMTVTQAMGNWVMQREADKQLGLSRTERTMKAMNDFFTVKATSDGIVLDKVVEYTSPKYRFDTSNKWTPLSNMIRGVANEWLDIGHHIAVDQQNIYNHTKGIGEQSAAGDFKTLVNAGLAAGMFTPGGLKFAAGFAGLEKVSPGTPDKVMEVFMKPGELLSTWYAHQVNTQLQTDLAALDPADTVGASRLRSEAEDKVRASEWVFQGLNLVGGALLVHGTVKRAKDILKYEKELKTGTELQKAAMDYFDAVVNNKPLAPYEARLGKVAFEMADKLTKSQKAVRQIEALKQKGVKVEGAMVRTKQREWIKKAQDFVAEIFPPELRTPEIKALVERKIPKNAKQMDKMYSEMRDMMGWEAGENRLVFKTGGREGRPGIERPAPPPSVKHTPQEFTKAMQPAKKKYPGFLTEYTPKEYAAMERFLTPEKDAGYAIRGGNELVSVFNVGEKGRGKQMVVDAIDKGAVKLDAYDGFLVDYYKQFGFEEVSRMKWDDKYAHPKWDHAKYGKPDVVEMKLNPKKYEQFRADNPDLGATRGAAGLPEGRDGAIGGRDRAVEAKPPRELKKAAGDVFKEAKPLKSGQLTRKLKHTEEFQEFSRYAEKIADYDIDKQMIGVKRGITITAERVAEQLDGRIDGPIYNKLVKPAYDARVKINKDLKQFRETLKNIKVLRYSSADVEATDFAEGKIKTASPKAQELEAYGRQLYDYFYDAVNAERVALGLDPFPKRKDYVPHIREMNVLMEIFHDYSAISREAAIKVRKERIMDENPGIDDVTARQRAKREVEGSEGLEIYIDPKQPQFRFWKERLTDWNENRSYIYALETYARYSYEYIHKAQVVAKNKAFIDALPLNAKIFYKQWNAEQVAGYDPPSIVAKETQKAVMSVRNTLGGNIIAGNFGTMFLQILSWAQVVALAGWKNTLYGAAQRIGSYLNPGATMYKQSRTFTTRSLADDVGLGETAVELLIRQLAKTKHRDKAAVALHTIETGRAFLQGALEVFDGFTVGGTFNAFYRRGIKDLGLTPEQAFEYADIMAGKTQANYFKEALPPLLNTFEGKILGQFGTYGFNQWELLRKDFGKEHAKGYKDVEAGRVTKESKVLVRHVLSAIVAAYIIDFISEQLSGRTPYEVKPIVDAMLEGDARKTALQTRDSIMSYVPFLSSQKFGGHSPVGTLLWDIKEAIAGREDKAAEAIERFETQHVWNLLAPYAGSQARKFLEALEANTDINVPFIVDRTKTKGGRIRYDIEGWAEKAKSFMFGPSATEAADAYYQQFKSGSSKKSSLIDSPSKLIKSKGVQSPSQLLKGRE